MKKKLYFENRADAQKEANSLHTYVNFVYDTTTGELKLVDSFGGEVKELVIGTAAAVSTDEEGGEGSGEGGQGEGGEGGEGQGEGGSEGGETPEP